MCAFECTDFISIQESEQTNFLVRRDALLEQKQGIIVICQWREDQW